MAQTNHPALSVILPVYNEAENLRSLHESVSAVMEQVGRSHEIIYCDDGSTDGSTDILRALAVENPQVKLLLLRRNFGQTAALVAGLDHARGDILILLDSDLQNDPRDIPKLLELIDQGYDIVSGWRRRRQDPFLTKVLPSKIANRLISWITGVHLHDHGCTLKAYRREFFAAFPFMERCTASSPFMAIGWAPRSAKWKFCTTPGGAENPSIP
jgi:glycosyltransferase involved in cell wall biosynthesis